MNLPKALPDSAVCWVEIDVQKAQLISDAGDHKRKVVPVEFEQGNLWQKSLEAPANGGERGKGDMLQEHVYPVAQTLILTRSKVRVSGSWNDAGQVESCSDFDKVYIIC